MGLGKFLSNATAAVGKGISSTTKAVGKVGIGKLTIANATSTLTHAGIGNVNLANASAELKKGINTATHIPVLGPVIGVTTHIHLINAVNNVARGQRVDRAAMSVLNNKIHDYKEVAPYAASIVSFVPGIGPGIGAGIAAGAALAEGKRWSDIAIEAAKGAIPGGAIAKAAFDMATAAARGKPIEQIGIAALPINDKAKAAIQAGLELTRDLASGKRVDQALLTRVNDALNIAGVKGKAAQVISSGANLTKDIASGQSVDKALLARVDDALKLGGPEVFKALQVGTAIGVARKLQDVTMREIAKPEAQRALMEIGKGVINQTPLLAQGLKLNANPNFQRAFEVASGIMSGKSANESMLLGLRDSLTPEGKMGFDAAASYFIGKNKINSKPLAGRNPPKRLNDKKAGPVQSFAYFSTHGLVGAADNQKVALVKRMAEIPDMRAGAADAIRSIAAERTKETSFWERLKKWFTG